MGTSLLLLFHDQGGSGALRMPPALAAFILSYSAAVSTLETCNSAYFRAGIACAGNGTSEDWSGSKYCPDRGVVIAVGTQIGNNCKSLYIAAHLLTGPLFGALADHRGKLLCIAIGAILMLISALSASLASALAGGTPVDEEGSLVLSWPLVMAYVILGGVSSTSAPITALCNDLCRPEERPAMFTLLSALNGSGAMIGMVVGVQLLSLKIMDYTVAMLGVAVMLGSASLPLFYVRSPTRAIVVPTESNYAAVQPVKRDAPSSDIVVIARSLRRVAGSSSFLRHYCFASALQVAGFAGYGSLLVPLTLAMGWEQGRFEQLVIVSALPACALSIWASNAFLFKRMGATGVLRLALLFMVAGWGAMLTIQRLGAAAILIGCTLIGLAAVGGPAGSVVMAEHIPANSLAQANALNSAVISLVVIVALPAFAAAFGAVGERSVLLPLGSLALVAVGAVFMWKAAALPREAADATDDSTPEQSYSPPVVSSKVHDDLKPHGVVLL